MKNENDLRDELQSRIPSAGDAYWESIDERLAAIEASQDFDDVDALADTGAGVTRLTSVKKTETSNSRGRYLLAAAAIVALLGLGAVVLNNRTGTGPDTVAVLDVAGQADGSSESQQGITDEQERAGDQDSTARAADQNPPLQALQARLNGEVATATPSYCFQSEPNTIKLGQPDSERVRSPWRRVALFGATSSGQVTIATWDDATDPNDVDGALFHSAVAAGALDGQFEASFAAGALESLEGEYRETLPVTLTDAKLIVGSVEMSLVACAEIQDAIDAVYGPADSAADLEPQVVQTAGPIRVNGETPWQAMRDRLGDAGAELGVAGPFCFASDRSYSILRPDYEELFESPTIASVSILADGQLDLVMKQGDEVTSHFAAIVAGDADAVFQIELSIVEAEGANWLDTVVQPIALTDESLIVREWPLPAADCAGIPELARARELAAEMRAWQAENVEPDWTRWRFIDGPVNFRATPGLDGEIIGSWAGDERAILGTGVEVEADGYVWVELAAEGERLGGWVAKDFVRPDFGDAGPSCFADDQTALLLDMGSPEQQIGGAVYTLVDGEVTYVAVTGRLVDTTTDGISEYFILAQQALENVVESQTWELSDEGFATSYGLLGPIDCAERANENARAASTIREYPELPE